MSMLQRRIKRPGNSSLPRSGSSSRAASGAATPHYDSSDEEDEYTSNSYLSPTSAVRADALARSIESLLVLEQEQAEADEPKSVKDKVLASMDVLQTDRRNSSLETREQALVTIIRVFSQKYEPEKFDSWFCGVLAKSFLTARSELERLLSVQALCLAGTIAIDDLSDELPPVFDKLGELMNEMDGQVSSKANFAVAYCFLKYIYNYGGGGYLVDELVGKLIDLASELSPDEAPLASALLVGSGLLVTVPEHPNPVINENILTLIDILDQGAPVAKIAAGKVIALYVQIYDYADPEDDEEEETERIPFVDYDELENKLKSLIGLSSKKISKKTKKEQRSLFRDVLSAVKLYSSPESRQSLTHDDLLITHIKLSRSKSLNIDSWAKLLLVQHLKWTFGSGLHTQIANNPFVKELVDSSVVAGGSSSSTSFTNDAEPAEKAHRYERKPRHHEGYWLQVKQGMLRDKHIKEQRIEKQIDQGLIPG